MLISRRDAVFLCVQSSAVLPEFRPAATGEMQLDPVHSWELCSIYNARCTCLSSWINLTGMNASHWGYNMGGNRRVMSALPSHPGRIHQKMTAGTKSITNTVDEDEMIRIFVILSLCFIWICNKGVLMLQRSLLQIFFFQPVAQK